MKEIFKKWLIWKWSTPNETLLQDYLSTFSNPAGQRILYHLIDTVYNTIYFGKSELELGFHNGRRSLVHEILENLDRAEHPSKYDTTVFTEGQGIENGLAG